MGSEIKGLTATSNFDVGDLQRLRSQQENLTNIKEKKVHSAKEIEDASSQFEGMLLQQMFKSMWSSVPKDGMLSGSKEEGMYRDMLNESLSNSIAEGQGIGIKEVIAREMREKEKK